MFRGSISNDAEESRSLEKKTRIDGTKLIPMKLTALQLAAKNIAHRHDARRVAFTLIELLVVVAVIGILASLLLPALTKAKAQTQSTACRNNLKHLQLSWLMYVDDYEGRFPPNRLAFAGYGWCSLPGSWVLGNAQADATTANIKRGLLFPFVRNPAVYRCPSDQSKVGAMANIARTRSYSLNYFLSTTLGWERPPASCPERRPNLYDSPDNRTAKDSDLIGPETKTNYSQLTEPPPAQVFVFLDVHEKSIDSGEFGLNLKRQEWEHLPADRHNRGCNLSFADGHVEHYGWRVPKKFLHPGQRVEDLERQDFRRLAQGVPDRL